MMGSLLLVVTALPAYLWYNGLGWFQAGLFGAFFAATGLSITVGYHRLFSHLAFKTHWPVRCFTLLFGAAAFENSALCWASDHRRHHKFVDDAHDPYDITRGFFHAHMGWMLFKLGPDAPLDNVPDLVQDRLVRWQHRFYLPLAVTMGFGLPALLGWLWGGGRGALGGFLVAGVARIVLVQQMTFCINSLCHTIGRQPYSSRCTARDSWLLALFTFGEGYHNFHHEFQHDYRNGVKAWQFDPSKWCIWSLHRVGLAHRLRRTPPEKVLLAEVSEQERRLAARLGPRCRLPQAVRSRLEAAAHRRQEAARNWERRWAEYSAAAERRVDASCERLAEAERHLREAAAHLRATIEHWYDAHQLAQTALA